MELEKELVGYQILSANTIPMSDGDQYSKKWIIAIAVTLASMMELIDTSIVNVALTQMSANLGATLDEIAWVSTGYIVAAVIVLPMTGWLSGYFDSCCCLEQRRHPFPGDGGIG